MITLRQAQAAFRLDDRITIIAQNSPYYGLAGVVIGFDALDNTKAVIKFDRAFNGKLVDFIPIDQLQIQQLSQKEEDVMSDTKTAQTTAQMEKEIPVKVTPIEPKIDLDKGAKPAPGKEAPAAPTADVKPAPEKDESGVRNMEDRVNTLIKDVTRVKTSLNAYLLSAYKLSLSADELDEIVKKILSSISSYVADITEERVEEIAIGAGILKGNDKKK